VFTLYEEEKLVEMSPKFIFTVIAFRASDEARGKANNIKSSAICGMRKYT
jgi:hypothetical protein